MHVCRSDSLAVRTRMERKERDSVRARQWSDVRSPAQRPGFTCAPTKINCNQHRCINQIVRRVGSERRIGTVGTGQSSALPLRMICRWHALRETLLYPGSLRIPFETDVEEKGGAYPLRKVLPYRRKFHVAYKQIIPITDKNVHPIRDIFSSNERIIVQFYWPWNPIIVTIFL